MRNLKRALRLALAFVMVMSMMVVGAGAVSIDDFSDKDQIVNTEAVMTMVSLGVINSKDDGSYDPTGIVTRAEMAKLIAVTLNGGKDPPWAPSLPTSPAPRATGLSPTSPTLPALASSTAAATAPSVPTTRSPALRLPRCSSPCWATAATSRASPAPTGL